MLSIKKNIHRRFLLACFACVVSIFIFGLKTNTAQAHPLLHAPTSPILSTPLAPLLSSPTPHRAFTSTTLSTNKTRYSTRRQALNSSGVYLSIPVLIIDIIPLLGNLIALPTRSARTAWGILGVSFGALGCLLTIPSMLIPYVGPSLLAFQVLIMALGTTNLLLDHLQQNQQETALSAWSQPHVNIQFLGSVVHGVF